MRLKPMWDYMTDPKSTRGAAQFRVTTMYASPVVFASECLGMYVVYLPRYAETCLGGLPTVGTHCLEMGYRGMYPPPTFFFKKKVCV